MIRQNTKQVEYGDFQTPDELASRVVKLLHDKGIAPATIVEPTCGQGSFLMAALKQFKGAKRAIGVEINPIYFGEAHRRVTGLDCPQQVDLHQSDFFSFHWAEVFDAAESPILILGNPPWVTSSQLGSLESTNLPAKSNFKKHRGLDAVTGKSNFDIAEWMLIHLLKWAAAKDAVLAMLVKTSVARRIVSHAWNHSWPLSQAAIYTFDARKYFNVSAEAGLLVCRLGKKGHARCNVYDLDAPTTLRRSLASHDGCLLSNLDAFQKHSVLLQSPSQNPLYRWRSGVKHDCSKVMELEKRLGTLTNGHGETVVLESTCLYPMLKGSSVANGKAKSSKYMLVTQTQMGQPTDHVQMVAPKTWAYLLSHADELDRRGSSIYRNNPRFSIFGIGEYTFTRWKVAICGLYKRLRFSVIGPHDDKPVVMDDTVYYLPADSEHEAQLVADLLGTPEAKEFLEAFIFWDAKRPITAEILNKLNIAALAKLHDKLDILLDLKRRSLSAVVWQDRLF